MKNIHNMGWSVGYNGIVIGGTGLEINTFKDYQNGVVMYNTGEPIVKENTFTKCLQAVEAVSCGYAMALGTGNANFNENNFNNCIFGIYCRESQGTPKIVLNKFNINKQYNIDEYGLEAIRVENIMQDAFPIVKENEMNNMAIGIHLRNAIKAQVRFNHYTTQITNADIAVLSLPNIGVWIDNCTNSTIAENTIERTGDVSIDAQKDLMQGINMDISTNCVVHLNNTTNMGTDINVIANCDPATISCNNMTSSFQGINFAAATITAFSWYPTDYSSTDNTWNGDYLLNNNERISGGFNGGFALDWYHQGALAANNMFCPFYNSGAVVPQPNASNNGCPESTPDNNALKQVQNAALNLAQYNENVSQNRYIDDAGGYELMYRDSIKRDSINTMYPYIATWYNAIKLASIGKFEDIKKLLANDEKQEAINKANSISSSNLIYQNLKSLALLFANNLIHSDSIPTDSTVVFSLNQIAVQDPTLGGEAVFIARAILRKDVFANNETTNRIREEDVLQNVDEAIKLNVFPNPTNQFFTIELNKFYNNISIENMIGLEVLYVKTQSNKQKINCERLENGCYILKCKRGNITVAQTKLIINK